MDSSGQLNELSHYHQLVERSKKIGYEVTKVVFRGYHAGNRLQVCLSVCTQRQRHQKRVWVVSSVYTLHCM